MRFSPDEGAGEVASHARPCCRTCFHIHPEQNGLRRDTLVLPVLSLTVRATCPCTTFLLLHRKVINHVALINPSHHNNVPQSQHYDSFAMAFPFVEVKHCTDCSSFSYIDTYTHRRLLLSPLKKYRWTFVTHSAPFLLSPSVKPGAANAFTIERLMLRVYVSKVILPLG